MKDFCIRLDHYLVVIIPLALKLYQYFFKITFYVILINWRAVSSSSNDDDDDEGGLSSAASSNEEND